MTAPTSPRKPARWRQPARFVVFAAVYLGACVLWGSITSAVVWTAVANSSSDPPASAYLVGIAMAHFMAAVLAAVFAPMVDVDRRRAVLVALPAIGTFWYAAVLLTRLAALPDRPWRDHRDDFDLPFGAALILVPLLGPPMRRNRAPE